MKVPLRGDKALDIEKKIKKNWDTFFLFVEKIPTAIKLDGGGGPSRTGGLILGSGFVPEPPSFAV